MNKKIILLIISFFIMLSLFLTGISYANESFEKITVNVEKGDNLFRIFTKMKISAKDSKVFIRSLKRRIDLRRISIGQKIDFYFDADMKKLLVVSFPLKRNITVLAWKEKKRVNSARISNSLVLDRIKAVFNMENFRPKPGQYSIKVKKGDNLTKILSNYGADLNEIQNIISAFSSVKNLRKLQPEDEISMFYFSGAEGVYLNKLQLIMSGEKILVKKDDFGIFRIASEPSTEEEKSYSVKEYNVSSGDTILGQLKDAGWTKKEARNAVDAFSTVYDPKKIKVGSKLIFPKDLRIRAFVFSIDKDMAVLVTTIGKGKFLAKKESLYSSRALVSSLKYAEVLKIDELEGLDEKQEIKKEVERSEVSKNNEKKLLNQIEEVEDFYIPMDLFEGKILKGDTLMSRLYALGEKKKDIRQSIRVLSKITDPNLIRVGSDFIVALSTGKYPMKGFYIGVTKSQGYLVEISKNNNYIAINVRNKKAVAILLKLKKADIKTEKRAEEKWVNESLTVQNDYKILNFEFKKGDTLSHLFAKAQISERNSASLVKKLETVYNPKNFYIGQKIKLALSVGEPTSLLGIIVELDKIRSIEIFYIDDTYKINRYEKKTYVKVHKNYGEVDTSLYMAAKKVGMPISVLMELVRIFSFDVDFQREVQSGDAFEVLYERKYISFNKPVNNGTVTRASLILGGEKITFYRFEDKYNGISDYFDADGHSVRKALMRTPLDGARLTSGFGKRKHPILGYNKMHRGVDFGAPRNTPVYAAGDGTIEFLGRNGGYGKYILIRHNSDYKTAYAHLARFAKMLKKRKRVKQGDIIGYVGSTGRSTGPHLHYEILFRSKQVNPLKVRLPQGIRLSGKLYNKFLQRRDRLDKLWNDL